MPRLVTVIGGGFAGLSAATALAAQGFQVTLLEGRQVLGGRAYSFVDPQTGDAVDNGQHLFMGCYRETQAFLERIGSLNLLRFQPNLAVEFFLGGRRRAHLRCWPLPSPWHLISGLARLSTLSWADRWRLRHIHRALQEARRHPEPLEGLTVTEWLRQARQSERARRHLWDPIAVAALNEDPSVASAGPFATVLAQAFFDRRKASRLGLSAVGLSDLYARAAREFIEARGGNILLKAPVAELELSDGRVEAVILRDGTRSRADWVISAVSPPAFLKMLPPAARANEPVFQRVSRLKYAPIVSIHLWFDREVTPVAFGALLGTQVHWLFNKNRIHGHRPSGPWFVSLVLSGAHGFLDWTDQRLTSMALEELRRLFPAAREAMLTRFLVIKEHQATLSLAPGSEALRPDLQSPYGNLLIAGDWTRTGLPATIESACLSGHRCAERVVRREMEYQA